MEREIIDGYAYSLIEEEISKSEDYEVARKFFQDRLAKEIDSTVLTPDLNGNPDEGIPKHLYADLDADAIRKFCEDHSLSLNAFFMSAVVLNLNKFTFSDKTLITSIFNGRTSPNYYNTQGFLVKTIPLVFDNENRQLQVSKFINRVDGVWKETINNSIYPYTQIADEFQLKPEFFYNYNEFLETDEIIIDNESYESKDVFDENLITTDSKIDLTVTNDLDGIRLDIEYNNQLYSEDYVQLFADSLKHILNEFMENDIDGY